MNGETIKNNAVDRIIVYLSVISVLFFSYLPFLYIFNNSGLDKTAIYLFLLSSSVCLLIFNLFSSSKIDKKILIGFALYMIFPMYALLNFSFAKYAFNDIHNIRTVVVINTLVVVLSLFCRNHKGDILNLLFWASSIYVLFSMFSYMRGYISTDSRAFQNIFSGIGIDGSIYQNINMYLGIYIISSLFVLDSEDKKPVRLLLLLGSLFSALTMFVVGGRASVVALVFVLTLYLFHNVKNSLSTSRKTVKLVLTGFLFLLFGLLFFNNIVYFFENSITYKRFLILTEDANSSLRPFLFSKGIELFLLDYKTFLIGAGINSFPVYINEFGATGAYPHNVFIELLAEYGIIGLVIFMSPIVYILSIRRSRLGSIYGNSKNEKAVFLFLLYFWTIYSFTGGLRSSWVLMFFTYLIFPSSSNIVHRKRKYLLSTPSICA